MQAAIQLYSIHLQGGKRADLALHCVLKHVTIFILICMLISLGLFSLPA